MFIKIQNIFHLKNGSVLVKDLYRLVDFTFTLFYLPSSFLLKISFILVFFIGFLSDIFFLKKPSSKFLLQLVVIFFTIFYTADLRIIGTKIFYLDYLLKTEIINIFFTLFCFLILILIN